MSDSDSNPEIFSVRIVSIDYYMAPPIPGVDICYSSFHGGKVKEVPVIRVYGSTPSGQKTCLHIHKALPYLYVPCSDIALQPDQEDDAYTNKVAASLEKALKLKGSAGSTRQHVHGCSLVRARRFYGYYSFEELFVKIYLYYPQDVSRAANLLLAGAVLDKSLQPHESHIPFILQFLVDYNLYGMGYLHLSKMKFRLPIPDFSCKKLNINSQHRMADPGAGVCLESKMWISSMIPPDWMWSPPSEFDASSNDKAHCPKRQSICELEGDASVDEILNQQFKMYSSLSQTCSDVKMVQSLVPIWEEQQKRSGIHEATMPPDPGKPIPGDVMKLLSVGLDFEQKFLQLCSEAEASLSFTPSQKEFRETDIIGSASPPGSLCEDAKLHEEGKGTDLKLLTVDEMQSSEMIGVLDMKAADKEAQNLLKWLATSQAAEDINSDDELVCETILSPLLPASTIDKVLEKANMAYESESQKECQDILDSIDDVLELELSKEKPSCSSYLSRPTEASSNSMIPQVDGSTDEFLSPSASLAGTSSAVELNSESKSASEFHVLHNTDTSTASKDKRNKQWGSLPFSMTDKFDNDEHATLHVCPFEGETGGYADSDYLTRNEVRNSACIRRNVDKGASELKEVNRLVNCSLRDLMRRKRSYRVEQTEWEPGTTKKLLLDRHEGSNTCLWKKQLDLETMQIDDEEEETELQKNCDLEASNHDNLVCEKVQPPAGSDNFLQASMPKDECFGQHEMEGLDANTVLRNCTDNSETCTDVYLLKTDADHETRAPEGCQQTNFAASSSVQISCFDHKVSGKHNCMGQSSHGSIPFVQHGQTKFYENAMGKSAVSDMEVLLGENQKHDENLMRETIGSELNFDDLKGNHMVKLTGITIGKKTPLTDKNLESNMSLSTISNARLHLDEESCHEMSGNAPDVFLPISTRDSQKEMNTWNTFLTVKAPRSHWTKGVSTHYQNDGSPLYLLTPNILPPSMVSVHRWLFCDERDQTLQETDAEGKDVPECASGPPLGAKLYQDAGAEKKSPCNSGGQTERVKTCLDGLQDISQISGPDGKSSFTPLSQIGFRDPASIGCGQQLTLLSIEVNRTSELARVFGIDFFSVLSRGSQYRVESMFLRLAHTQNYLAISPRNQQVASQPAMECLPLVMEPESGFYSDPVVVFDFQSLYPSMIIAYNLCFCTCLGKVVASKANTLGVSSFSPEQHVLQNLKDQILLTPNGVMFVPSKIRRGVLPRLLEEILSTRIMVKQAIKKLAPSEQVLQRIFNARQLALKLISNVTYGYTAAGFSGRMPCAELADSIVQCGRSTLEKAISFVNLHEKWNAKVIYGDTDSMFVLLKGRTIKESFQIGTEIASAITAMNPSPVTLKMEKVYHPCFLLTKKRYVGYSYESPDQIEPTFDAKGIETVRRDTCGAVAKIMEQSLRIFFEHQDLLEVKTYLRRQWKRILSGRFSLKDFVFAKEVRLGTYSARISSLPPAAIVATKAMRVDPRAEPRYAERIPYVVVHGEPGARLVDMVVDPLEVLAIDSPFRINDLYYINKQIIPALQRVFGLVGADLNQWFSEMPRPIREASTKHTFTSNFHRTRIDYYYLSKHCVLCGGLVQASTHLCNQCSENGVAAATAVISKTSKLEQEMQHLVAICHHCGGGDRLLENSVKCTSISCSVFYERRKVQKELLAATHVAADKGFYPRCMVEWF